MRVFINVVLLNIILLSSCVTQKNNLRVSQTSYCIPPNNYVYDSTYLPLADIMPLLKEDSLLRQKYSYHELLIANAAGTLLLLQDLTHMYENRSQENLVFILLKKQAIYNRLLLASIEVAGLAAELDCESERSKQLATYLDQKNDTRIQKYTIISVVTGAVTAIATLGNNTTNTQLIIGVVGSIVSATFGGLAAFSSRQTILFKHQRNLLTDIWYDSKTSAYYPPFIWYILKEKQFTSGGTYSTIHNLKERWIEEGMVEVSDKKKSKLYSDALHFVHPGLVDTSNTSQTKLYFGTGGKYQADDLHTRTNMINQLKAEVRAVNQNLQTLMLKLAD